MAGAGVAVREFVPVVALATGEAAERVLAVVTHAGAHQVVRHGPSTYRLTRRYRPMWPLPSRTETCDVSIGVDQATGHTVVYLEGRLPAGTLHAVRLALGGTVPTVTAAPPAYTGPPMPAMSMPPPPPTSPPAGQPQAGQLPAAGPGGWGAAVTAPPTTPMAAGPRPQSIAVEFDDGRRASLGLLILVGRNPAASPDEFAAQLVAVDDDSRSVSKTHLALGCDERGAWVVDRHSTNGTAVLEAAGRMRCPPGERVYLRLPATVRFGDRTLRVVTD
ncbi:FHA domain-containing protein [Luedemannella helvata]|uniref:FHA domain-containing protein n=1 Tax=Luedemannella helvata TaxID=349315 RepID=UPI0031E27161